MNEELLNNEANKAELEKLEKIKKSLSNLENKKSKFLFCVPESQTPTASIYEIYFHATVVGKMGYDVIMLTEKDDYIIPNWIEESLTKYKHTSMANSKIEVGPEDIMIIPEVYSNIMEQTKNLPCIRIGLLQSIDYMFNSLIPGTDWKTFGIDNVITTSETLKNMVNSFCGEGKFNVKHYNVGIPDYFKRGDKPKKPIISIVGRNPNEISKFVKLFFSKYPQYSWITFDPMLTRSKPPQAMRRIDFAKRLQENFAAVWIDRIASFGTFPLECMKTGTIPICLKPDITPEYMVEKTENGLRVNEGSGVWTDNFYDLPIIVGEVLIKFLDDAISDELYDSMDKISSKYSQENSETELSKIYGEFIETRISIFKKALELNN
jgi:hypothetical protein